MTEEPILTDWPMPSEAEMKFYNTRYPYTPPKAPYGYPYHLLDGRGCVIIDENGIEHIECKEGCLPLEKRPEGWREWQRAEWWVNGQMVNPALPDAPTTGEIIKTNAEMRRGAPTEEIVRSGPGVERDRELIEEFQQEGLFVLLGAG